MKFLKNILVAAMLAVGCTLPAMADQFDLYGGTDTRVVAALHVTAQGSNNTATTPMFGLNGIATLQIWFGPDNASGTGAFTVQTSPDNTNWSTMTSCCVSTVYTNTYTNNIYAAAVTTAYTNLLHGSSVLTPTAATAGFATPYIVPLLLTNTGVFQLTNAANAEVAFEVVDQPKYIRLAVTTGGTGTNSAFGAVLRGHKIY